MYLCFLPSKYLSRLTGGDFVFGILASFPNTRCISHSYISNRIRISHMKYTNSIRIHDAKKAPIFSISTKYECLKFKIEPAKPHFATSMTIHRGKLIFSIKSFALRREPYKTNGFVVLSRQGWTHLNVYGFP